MVNFVFVLFATGWCVGEWSIQTWLRVIILLIWLFLLQLYVNYYPHHGKKDGTCQISLDLDIEWNKTMAINLIENVHANTYVNMWIFEKKKKMIIYILQ